MAEVAKVAEVANKNSATSVTNVTFAMLRIEKCVLIIMEIVLWTYFLRTFYGLLQMCSQRVRGKQQ